MAIAAGCAGQGQASPEVSVPSPDEAWVASACQPVSVDTTGWLSYRIGDLMIQAPPEYQGSGFGYEFSIRGPGGFLYLHLHRNARYDFDATNVARRGQTWCNGSLGGYQAEILSWFDGFARTSARTPRIQSAIQNPQTPQAAINYNYVARLEATWGGQDQDKWLFARVGASRLRDAQQLRAALHTLRATQ